MNRRDICDKITSIMDKVWSIFRKIYEYIKGIFRKKPKHIPHEKKVVRMYGEILNELLDKAGVFQYEDVLREYGIDKKYNYIAKLSQGIFIEDIINIIKDSSLSLQEKAERIIEYYEEGSPRVKELIDKLNSLEPTEELIESLKLYGLPMATERDLRLAGYQIDKNDKSRYWEYTKKRFIVNVEQGVKSVKSEIEIYTEYLEEYAQKGDRERLQEYLSKIENNLKLYKRQIIEVQG